VCVWRIIYIFANTDLDGFEEVAGCCKVEDHGALEFAYFFFDSSVAFKGLAPFQMDFLFVPLGQPS
jgi:hypothetical protein